MRFHFGPTWLARIVSIALAGCAAKDGGKQQGQPAGAARRGAVAPSPATLKAVDLSDAVRPTVLPGPVELAAARNEWTSAVFEVSNRVLNGTYTLRLNGLTPAGANITFDVYQVLSMPVDVNRAGYARHTGLKTSLSQLPRALIPIPQAAPGVVDVSTLRDANRPNDPTAAAPPADPALLWVDVHVPPDASAGTFASSVDLLAGGKLVASVPLKLKVYDFALPVERHLQVVGRVRWNDLTRLYQNHFDLIRPNLMDRGDPKYAGAIQTLDSLVDLAHRHRVAAVVPGLHPTVKWPPGAPPDVEWREFDSVVTPWLTGRAFADGVPIGFWPLPAPGVLAQFDRESQLQYWSQAATHFDQSDWIDRSPIWVEKVTPGRADDAESAALSGSAAETMAVHNRVRAVVPLEADQLRLVDPAAPPQAADKLPRIDPVSTTRLYAAAPGLVFSPPMRLWPDGVDQPRRYLRTDLPALVPYVGAGGDERDVRLWAWLAYLRGAELIHWNATLPSLSQPGEAADPNELIWFYPGWWFGLDEPVPTIQLKWLRRAQQDYEYLWLARNRGDRNVRINALLMARLISKPVEIQPGQYPDPAYALMSGTTDQQVWTKAQDLLAEMIELHKPGGDGGQAVVVDLNRKHENEIEMLRWAEPQEKPLLMGRTTEWFVPPPAAPGGAGGAGAAADGAGAAADGAVDGRRLADNAAGGPRVHLRFGVDIYNASDVTGVNDLLGWTGASGGWEISPQPTPVPALATYKVQRTVMDARFDPMKVTPAAREPLKLTFTNGFRPDRKTDLEVVLPIANSDRREGGEITIDGAVDKDWVEADLVHDGKLVKMLDRPGLQSHKLLRAERDAKVYTSWAGGFFFVAFDLDGINPNVINRAQNFVDYQFRRAWSEDLCEILIQPISPDGIPGPVLHVVCRPNGSIWVERKLPPGPDANGPRPWQEVQARIQYATRPAGEAWRGEVRIPWAAILETADAAAARVDADATGDAAAPASAEIPALLRFNFVQHRTSTGESASWCGPIDFGRDDALMGCLILRDPRGPRNLAGNRGGVGSATEER